MSTLLEVKDLKIGYGGNVIQGSINFTIRKKSYVCILGENGAGKTTLVKTLLGVISPLEGEIWIDRDVKSEGVGYLPQQSAHQRCFPTTVREVVLSGNQNHSKLFYSKEDKLRAAQAMADVGIYHLRKKSFNELSGGQQQKVLLARALCASKEVLVLDEPVTGLDVKSQDEFYDLLQKMNKTYGTTILMISHDKDVLEKNATHVLDVGKGGVELFTVEKYRKERANG